MHHPIRSSQDLLLPALSVPLIGLHAYSTRCPLDFRVELSHPLVCSPSLACALFTSPSAREILISVGYRQNIPIIRFQRKECPPYLNHKTIKPRRLASSALLFCSGPIQNPKQGDKQGHKSGLSGLRKCTYSRPSQVGQPLGFCDFDKGAEEKWEET